MIIEKINQDVASAFGSNILSFEKAKAELESTNRFKNYINYLGVLKTDELLIEVRDYITNLSETRVAPEILNKGKLLIDEIAKRMGKTSPATALVMRKIQRHLDEKLKYLGTFNQEPT